MSFTLQTLALPHPGRALARAAVRLVAENITNPEVLYDLDLALYEACANTAQHAYPPDQPGDLTLELRLFPGERIEADIMDKGCGFDSIPMEITNPPPVAEHGRGLYIMSRLTDSLELSNGEQGAVVSFTMQLQDEKWTKFE